MNGRGKRGDDVGALWRVAEEIKAAAKTERVIFWFIEGMALGLFPEGIRVLWDIRTRGGRGGVTEQRIRFHLAKLSISIARSA